MHVVNLSILHYYILLLYMYIHVMHNAINDTLEKKAVLPRAPHVYPKFLKINNNYYKL